MAINTRYGTPLNKDEVPKVTTTADARYGTPIMETQSVSEEPKEKGLVDKLVGREKALFTTGKSLVTGKIPLQEAGIQVVGGAAGVINDIATAVLGPAFEVMGMGFKGYYDEMIPSNIKKTLESKAKTIADSDAAKQGVQALQSGVQAWSSYKAENPEHAQTIEAVGNILTLLPIGKGAKVGVEAVEQPFMKVAGKVAGELAPAIEKSAIGSKTKFVEELLTPLETKKSAIAGVKRSTEVPYLLGKKTVVAPTLQEAEAIAEVVKIPKVNPGNTLQGNWNTINEAFISEAENLKNMLKISGAKYNKDVLFDNLKMAQKRLAEMPVVQGDPEKIAGQMMVAIEKLVKESTDSAVDLADVKIKFDRLVKGFKPNIFSSTASKTAFKESYTEIRNSIKQTLIDSAPNVKVERSLNKQHNLKTALDILDDKAADEADTSLGRLIQNATKALGVKSKIVQAVAATGGVGGLGAAAMFAPLAAGIGVPIVIGQTLKRVFTNPELRFQLAKGLRWLEAAAAKDPMLNSQIMNDLKIVKSALKANPAEGISTREVVESINNGGITLDIPKLMNMGGISNSYAVSIYPELSKVFPRKITATDLADYIEKNADYLLKEYHTLGGWFDTSTGNVYLDISVAVPDKKAAITLGKKYNQKAIMYLKDFTEIPTGGTGEMTKGLPPIAERLRGLYKPATASADRVAAISRRLKSKNVSATEKLRLETLKRMEKEAKVMYGSSSSVKSKFKRMKMSRR